MDEGTLFAEMQKETKAAIKVIMRHARETARKHGVPDDTDLMTQIAIIDQGDDNPLVQMVTDAVDVEEQPEVVH